MQINENIQEQMQFPVVEKRKGQLANGSIVECDVVAPVEIKFNSRSSCSAMVLPGDSEPLLGARPLEDMGYSSFASGIDFKSSSYILCPNEIKGDVIFTIRSNSYEQIYFLL